MYKNPRLKHVKKIMEIAKSISYWSMEGDVVGNQILDQCNLLLETEKKKRWTEREKRCGFDVLKSTMDICDDVVKRSKPSPQPEIKKLVRKRYELENITVRALGEAMERYSDKINELVERFNKLTKTK